MPDPVWQDHPNRFPNRRDALGRLAGLGLSGFVLARGSVGAASASSTQTAAKQDRMTISLRAGSIGVRAAFPEIVELAIEFGFEAVSPVTSFFDRSDDDQIARIVDRVTEAGLVFGAGSLPVDFRKDDQTFNESMRGFPRTCQRLRDAGITRIGTYISPADAERTYVENFRVHAERLRTAAQVCLDAGLRLGLEYVGPKTLWTAKRYPFLHTLAETQDLIAEIDRPNVGVILDSWHWYTADETLDDLRSLNDTEIVACDLNDAPAGIPRDQQIDNRRELPAATGVIDLKGFLGALAEIGYSGPVRAEPFNQALNALDNREAVEATAQAMTRAFETLRKA